MFKIMRNKALHQTAIPLGSIAASELGYSERKTAETPERPQPKTD